MGRVLDVVCYDLSVTKAKGSVPYPGYIRNRLPVSIDKLPGTMETRNGLFLDVVTVVWVVSSVTAPLPGAFRAPINLVTSLYQHVTFRDSPRVVPDPNETPNAKFPPSWMLDSYTIVMGCVLDSYVPPPLAFL